MKVSQLLFESVGAEALALIKTGKYDPAIRGSAARFKEALKKTGITSSDTTAQYAWSNYKHEHPKAVKRPKFNEHDPSTWPPGYSHKGNPMYLD